MTLDTPSTVVSMNPTSPNDAASASATVAPTRGLGYSPLQNEPVTEPNAPVVMSPVDFDSPEPSPAHGAAGSGRVILPTGTAANGYSYYPVY